MSQQTPSHDEPMPDAQQAASPETEEDDINGPRREERRVRVLPGSTDTAASFEIDNEDHTLGNALRWMVMKNPDVEFCGYSIPHPAEAKMNMRIQTYDGVTALEVLEKGLDDLMDLCDVVEGKFEHAHQQFVRERDGSSGSASTRRA